MVDVLERFFVRYTTQDQAGDLSLWQDRKRSMDGAEGVTRDVRVPGNE